MTDDTARRAATVRAEMAQEDLAARVETQVAARLDILPWRAKLAEALSREAEVSERYVGQGSYWDGLAAAMLPVLEAYGDYRATQAINAVTQAPSDGSH